MRVDGVDLFSVLDFIAYVCPGRNPIYATQLWNRAISNDSTSNEVMSTWHNCKFKGQGHVEAGNQGVGGYPRLFF